MEFIAVFCPHCGTCVNEPDIDDFQSELVNCHWCKKRHAISQVPLCRQLAHLSETQISAGLLAHTRRGLLDLRRRLREQEDPSVEAVMLMEALLYRMIGGHSQVFVEAVKQAWTGLLEGFDRDPGDLSRW